MRPLFPLRPIDSFQNLMKLWVARRPRRTHGRLRWRVNKSEGRTFDMIAKRTLWLGVIGLFAATMVASTPATAQQPSQKPNILFIMGDDIGWMQPSIYHQGLMDGETPNIDRIGQEGAKFMTYYAESSCTSGRNAFFTGMN